MSSEQKKAPAKKSPEEKSSTSQKVDKSKSDKLKADMDKLLDEIDSVLEENAEEFVKNFVQKGGE